MPQDWNWFFSSLSQSAAAIVGIFGAFIITKIFSNQTSFMEKKTKLKQLLTQAAKISDSADSYNMAWHNKHYNHPIFYKFRGFLDTEFPEDETPSVITDKIMEEFINKNDFSKYSEKRDIKQELLHITNKIFEQRVTERELQEAANKAEEEYSKSPLAALIGLPTIPSSLTHLTNFLNPQPHPSFLSYEEVYNTPWDKVTKERKGLENCYLDAKNHARLATDLLETIVGNPESPRQISAALLLVLFIFFVGVIYPLSFLPASGAPDIAISTDLIISHIISFKGVLLGVISIVFTIIIAIFYTTNSGMKYNQAEVAKTKELTNTNNYCKYFKFIDNTSSSEELSTRDSPQLG